ncbi:MAG: hypothetical protein DMF60_12585, partial [Acidobacteria bacterium]
LKDERLKAVLNGAAKAFGWGKSKREVVGYGIAGGFEKGGYVAACAEVSVDRANGKVKLLRVVEAFECGAIVNPNQLRNQIEGSVVMAIGGALFESIDFDNGKIANGRFSRYRVPRFSDVPVIETVLIDRKDLPSAGAGETPIVITWCQVSGVRYRVPGAWCQVPGVSPSSIALVSCLLQRGLSTITRSSTILSSSLAWISRRTPA